MQAYIPVLWFVSLVLTLPIAPPTSSAEITQTLNRPAPSGEQNRPVTLAIASDASIADDVARQFLSNLVNEDYTAAHQMYVDVAQQSISRLSLEQDWLDLVAESGKFEEVISSEVIDLDGLGMKRLVVLNCQFEDGKWNLFITLTEIHEIVDFSVATKEE